MKAEKTEMVTIEFTKGELEELIESAIRAKYPQLLDEKLWEWDDFFIEKEVHTSQFPKDKMAVYSLFSKKVSMAVKPLDNGDRVVYVDVREVCR